MSDNQQQPHKAEIIDIKKAVEERVRQENEHIPLPDEDFVIDSEFRKRCLRNNELGDGVLYATLQNGKFIYDATSGSWLCWSGHNWQRDIENQALAMVEDVALEYAEEISVVNRQIEACEDEDLRKYLLSVKKNLSRRVDRLRSTKGRRACLDFAATLPKSPITITGDRLDTLPLVLPCKNGVVDLETGGFRPGDPKDYLTLASPSEWHGIDAEAPGWEKALLDSQDGDEEMVGYLRRVFGYGITGLTNEDIFLLLHGENGRNGKGVMTETFQRVLGPLVGPFPAEMLLDQSRVRNSAGPSPDLMALRGRRLAFASETDQGRKWSASRVKWLSGGDTITARNPHDKLQIEFKPSHLLVMATNFKPRADSADPAFWARMHLVDFPVSFVENPVKPNERKIDRTLRDRLHKEAPGILAWLVRGCLEWQKNGLNPPKKVLEATAEYRRAEDDLADFLEQKCYQDKESETTAKSLYSSYKEWFSTNISDRVPTPKRFGNLMTKNFEKKKDGSGSIVYIGIGLK